MPANNRLLSLDVLRGFTVAGMILVNNAGACGYGYAPLRHAKWDGFTPADLVFPMFMFLMGHGLPRNLYGKILDIRLGLYHPNILIGIQHCIRVWKSIPHVIPYFLVINIFY